MTTLETIITDEELNVAFTNTNFGDRSMRDLIKFGLLKVACGYATGHTIKCIMQELGLIGKSHMKEGTLTKKGKEYLWECFGELGM